MQVGMHFLLGSAPRGVTNKIPKLQRRSYSVYAFSVQCSVIYNIFGGDFILIFFVLYSTLLHLPPLKFHCVVGCWDRTVATCALAVRRYNH
jgi:hypothetical protein